MSIKNKIWFNWHCPHCEHRNRATFGYQFEMPRYYSVIWNCEHCHKESKLEFILQVNGWYKKKKKFKIKKRRDSVQNEVKGNKKDRGYRNDKV